MFIIWAIVVFTWLPESVWPGLGEGGGGQGGDEEEDGEALHFYKFYFVSIVVEWENVIWEVAVFDGRDGVFYTRTTTRVSLPSSPQKKIGRTVEDVGVTL